MKRFFTKKTIILFVLGIVLGVAVWQFGPFKGTNGNGKKQLTHTVKKETLKETQTISGEVEADQKITLRFQSSGYISWIGVKKGDYVKKGQAIASLDQKELQKTLEKYLNTYMDSRLDFETTKDEYRAPAQDYWNLSWDQRNALDRAFQQAQYDLNSTVLDVELKNIALKYAVLTSPIDGIITKIDAPVAGVYVTSTQAEFEVTNPDSIYFSLLPDQNEVTGISASQSAEIIFDSYTEEKVLGTVKDIAFTPKTGETSTVYEVKIAYPVNDPSHTKYRLGMTGDATFVVREKQDVLAIPSSYIKTEKEKKYVTKEGQNKKKEKVFIEVGMESDTMTEVTAGLAEGDVIYD